MVRGRKVKKVWQRKEVQTEVWRGMDFTVTEEEMSWLNKCYVGFVHNPNAVYLLQDRLIDEGIFTFKVTPMGGDLVLIKPTEGEVFEDFVKDYEDLIETWFYDVRGWSPEMVAKEREAWIRCQGVPLHAWNSQFFEQIVGCLGSFISMDSGSMNGSSFDMARVMIRTSSWEVINRVIKVRINGLFYNIRLIEEPFVENAFGIRRSSTNDGSKSSSSSDSLSLSNFFVGSDMGNSIDTEDEVLIQQLLEEEEAQRKEKGRDVRCNTHDNEGSGSSKEQPTTDRDKELHVATVEKPLTQHNATQVDEEVEHAIEGHAVRVMEEINNSAELFVDIGLGPLAPMNVQASLPLQDLGVSEESISSWTSNNNPSHTSCVGIQGANNPLHSDSIPSCEQECE